jgi:hypothetical protein
MPWTRPLFTWFWRSKAWAEVDNMEEIDGKLYAYEFKWNTAAKSRFPQSLLEAYKPAVSEVIHRDNFWQSLNNYPY